MNILPKKRFSLTPSTTQRRTHTHENNTSAQNYGGQSGNDFAIMAPTKAGVKTNAFELSDENWTGTSVINWSLDDQQPSRRTNGYVQVGHDHNGWEKGTELSTVSKTNNDVRENLKYASKNDKGDTNWTGSTTIKQEQSTTDWGKVAGVGMTVTMSDAEQENAKQNALITFTDNSVSLSGGAFGTNGNVMFSTPYTAKWQKVDSDVPAATNADRVKLAGSSWTVKTKGGTALSAGGVELSSGGPFYNKYLEPSECSATAANRATWCWSTKTDQNGYYTATITDNINGKDINGNDYVGYDKDPAPGEFQFANLALAEFVMTEQAAPDGYKPTPDTTTYTFKTGEATKEGETVYPYPRITISTDPSLTTDDKHTDDDGTESHVPQIGNTANVFVEWQKVEMDENGTIPSNPTLLPGSVWTLTNTATNVSYEITDCTTATCSNNEYDKNGVVTVYHDQDATAGKFKLKGLKTGTYTLVEKTAPAGYSKTYVNYMIMVPASTQQDQTVHPQIITSGNSGTATDAEQIGNQLTKKLSIPVTKTMEGKWPENATYTFVLTGIQTDKNYKQLSPNQDAPLAASCYNADGTAKASCTVSVNQSTEDHRAFFQDIDIASAFAENEQTTKYFLYTIQEQGTNGKAGSGGVKDQVVYSKETWTIKVTAVRDASSLTITQDAPQSTNGTPATSHGVAQFINRNISVAALPLTGGTTGRYWMFIGGGIAVVAIAALALTNEWLKRKAVIV